MFEFIKVELRKVAPWWGGFVVVLLCYLVTRGDTLVSRDQSIYAVGAFLGVMVAWLAFADPGGTRSFMFSRPWLRHRLFLTRWALGLTLLAATLALVFVTIAAGGREWWQTRSHIQTSVFYPLIRWRELEVLCGNAG